MPNPTEDCFRALAIGSPDHILVATDLTDADYLLPHAIAQAKAYGADITLIHAISPPPIGAGTISYADEPKRDHDARLVMAGLKQQIEAHGVTCRTICPHGFANDVIREALERMGTGRLIMGTHGRTKLKQIALGSVTNSILTMASVPVFVVGPGARPAGRQSTPLKIVHPVSFIGDYIESARLAFDVANAYGSELVLLHVLDRGAPERADSIRAARWAENALRRLLSDERDSMPVVHVKVVAGDLVKEILNAVDETEADWIVMGMDGAFPLFHFRDSAAYRVTAAARCPVLILRHPPSRIDKTYTKEDNVASVIR
jgi:nucleotide-binding universal stress UspA family protein